MWEKQIKIGENPQYLDEKRKTNYWEEGEVKLSKNLNSRNAETNHIMFPATLGVEK